MHTAAPTTGFEEEEGLSVDETSSVGEVLISEDTAKAVLHLLMLKRKAKMAIAMAVAVTMETCFRDSMMHPPCRH